MIAAPVFCRRFIGRREELGLVAERCREAALGRGAIVLVGGEAGIGKTRFLTEVRLMLGGSATGYVAAQCFEHVQSPLGPFAEILREIDVRQPQILDGSPIRHALARSFPEIFEGVAARRPVVQSAGERRGQFAAIAEALHRLGNAQPTVIAIDDLHWADLASLDLLQYLSMKLAGAKLVILMTYRTDELHRGHPLTAALGRLQRAETLWHVTLGALSEIEMRAFVHSALEEHGEIEPETLREIVALAEGSPLFTEELLKHGIERASALGPIELPLTIRAAVLERLTDFDETSRALLMHAAVVGRRFEPEFLASITGLGEDAIIATLHQARDLQLIVEERGEPVRFSFRHALVREALYSELLLAEARPLHARIAAEIEQREDARDRVMELAYHWWAARAPEKAATYNERAGDIAGGRLAYDDSARFYERALEFLEDGSEAYAIVCEKLGNILRVANLHHPAIRSFERALAYFRRVANWEKIVELTSDIARQYWLLVEMEKSLRFRLDALEIAGAHRDHSLYFASLLYVANHYSLRGDAERASEYLERADALEGERRPAHEVVFHNTSGLIEALRGNHDASIAAYQRSIAVAPHVTDLHSEVNARFNLGYVATPFGDFDAARFGFESAVTLACERFIPVHEAYALAGLASMQLLAGDYAGARASIEKALEQAEPRHGLRIQLASAAIPLGLRSGDIAFAETFVREDVIDLAFRSMESQRIAPTCAAFAEWYVARGEPERARELLHRAAEKLCSIAPAPWTVTAFCSYGAEADLQRIRDLLARWALPDGNTAGKAFLALVDAFMARFAGADPRPHAECAERAFAALQFPYDRAVALELLDRGEEALELYRRIGDQRDARRLEAARPVNRRGRAPTDLTDREREVASLVARGKSNRAIAGELVISERTVESHLASIFNKLGMCSRTEIAARFPVR